MRKITIYTPTYNRAYKLPALYKSLLVQSCNNFEWLIIDDGSNDNTKELVNGWIVEGLIPIRYIFQRNMGMVAAHNTAHYNISTELSVCIDSDDCLSKNAVELILNKWNSCKQPHHMGIIGLDAYKDGKIVGDLLPKKLDECTFSELKYKFNISGDKKYVLRNDLVQKVLPYPYFEGEKFPAPSYLYLLLEQDYKFLLMNEILCIVEYLPDGNSMNKIKQYKDSPNAFAYYRVIKMKYAYNYVIRFKNAIHYVSSQLIAKNYRILKDSPYKLTTALAIPLGFLLYQYIIRTKHSSVNKRLNLK